MQAEAKAAGFELKYEPTFNDDKLTRLNLNIVQIKENGQRQNIQISDIDLEDSPNYKVAWNVNDEGNATDIACGEELKLREADQQALDELMASLEIDELMEEMEAINMDELTAEMEKLQENLANELDELNIATDVQLADLQELIRAEELLAMVDFEELLEDLDDLDEEELEEIRVEVETALAEAQREVEESINECKEARRECKTQAKKCKDGSKKILDELENDGLIKERSKRVKMTASNGKLKVNGKELPKELRNKYEALVMEYFEVDVNNKGMQWQWTHDE